MKFIIYLTLVLSFLTNITPLSAQQFNGTWESLGYGRWLTVTADRFEIKDITSQSCLPSMKGKLSELTDQLSLRNDTLAIVNGINTYYFIRSGDPGCKTDKKKKKDPIYNFEVLAETFKDHYAFFGERHIDWNSLYQKYRSQVSPNTSAPALYLIIKNMLDEFGDGHIQFSAPAKIEAKAQQLAKSKSEEPAEKRIPSWKLAQEVAANLLNSPKSKRGGTVRWGVLDGNIGYLQVNQMLGLGDYGIDDRASVPDYWKAYIPIMARKSVLELTNDEQSGMASILDEVMPDLKNTKGIIIDVRFNGGGKDEVGLEILSRFNQDQKVVGIKKAVQKPGFSPEVPIYVAGTQEPYLGPVCILTSKATASASEIFVMASLSLPNTTRIGGSTEGITSDMLDKTLPNGWEFSLSNETYLDNQGKNYEHIGIRPDYEIYASDSREEHYRSIQHDLENKKDAAILKALALIQ